MAFWKRATQTFALLVIASCCNPDAWAQEKLKIAVGMHGNWEDAAPELGSRAGIFQKHGLQLELLYTGGAGGALQAVISGSVDMAVGVGTAGVMAAFLRGAPVRIIGSATTGTKDIYWYVKSGSPIKSLKDAQPTTTIAYSSAGAATNFFVNGLLKTYKIDAKPIATGDMQATLTQVMTGQVDLGFAAPPMGLKQVEEGTIRIVARASDIPSTRDQTVRAIIVNADKLARNPQLVAKFVQAYAETVDWMYADPAALKEYERYSGTPERLTRKVMTEFYTKDMLDPYRMSGLQALMDDAVAFKFLKQPLNDAQLKDLIHVPQRPAAHAK